MISCGSEGPNSYLYSLGPVATRWTLFVLVRIFVHSGSQKPFDHGEVKRKPIRCQCHPLNPLHAKKAARLLSVSLATLDHMIDTGVLPPPRSIGGRRVYWHPDIFYGCLDQILRAERIPAGDADSSNSVNQTDVRESKRATRIDPSTDLRSVQTARERDCARLAELNK